MSDDTTTEQRWVAFGDAGAVGSIHRAGDEFEVRLMKDDAAHGSYPTLDAAKGRDPREHAAGIGPPRVPGALTPPSPHTNAARLHR